MRLSLITLSGTLSAEDDRDNTRLPLAMIGSSFPKGCFTKARLILRTNLSAESVLPTAADPRVAVRERITEGRMPSGIASNG